MNAVSAAYRILFIDSVGIREDFDCMFELEDVVYHDLFFDTLSLFVSLQHCIVLFIMSAFVMLIERYRAMN